MENQMQGSTQKPGVHSQLNIALERIDMLDHEIDNLKDRLASYLVPTPDTIGKNPSPPSLPTSQTLELVSRLAQKINSTIEKVRNLQDMAEF